MIDLARRNWSVRSIQTKHIVKTVRTWFTNTKKFWGCITRLKRDKHIALESIIREH